MKKEKRLKKENGVLVMVCWSRCAGHGVGYGEGAEAVRRSAELQPLRIQTYVTASIRWLARRLPEFSNRHPEINLLLTTCAVDWEFDELNADVGLVYSETPPDPHFHWVPLFDYKLVPVCSPKLLNGLSQARSVQALSQLPLVSIYTEARNWDTWFEAAGVGGYMGTQVGSLAFTG